MKQFLTELKWLFEAGWPAWLFVILFFYVGFLIFTNVHGWPSWIAAPLTAAAMLILLVAVWFVLLLFSPLE
jgi:hypothetical protein